MTTKQTQDRPDTPGDDDTRGHFFVSCTPIKPMPVEQEPSWWQLPKVLWDSIQGR